MYSHDNSSLASVNSDELTWLDAYTRIIQDPSSLDYSAPNSPETDIPSNPLPYPSPTSDELSSSGLRAMSRRHHYQRSTKSSSAKAVSLPNNNKRSSKSLAAKRPNHPNLRPMASPPPLSAPSLSNSTSSPTSTRNDHSMSIPSSPRLAAKRCHSPTSAPPSPRSPEWIYRRPKSPTTPPRKRPDINRSASEFSATSISYFSEVSSGSPLLGCEFGSSSTPQDAPTLWTSILRPRKRSGSVKSVASSLNKSTEIPSLWFGADEVCASSSSFSGSRSKKAAAVSPIMKARHLPKSPSQASFSSAGRIQRNRSSSVSSSISSVSTATTSSVSQPLTPTTSPSLSPMITKKFKPNPNHTCIVEIDEPESEVEREERLMGFPGLRRNADVAISSSSSSGLLARSGSLLKLKIDTRSCTSSSKSVKFVETPIVHYASAGYEPDFWHIPGEESDMDMGDETEKENVVVRERQPATPALSISHPYAYAKGVQMDVDEEEESRDMVRQRIPTPDYRPEDRDVMCITPTPERLQERGGRSLKRLSVKRKPSSRSSWRSAPSSSPSRSVTPRPTISGPFALGSLPTQPVAPPPLPPKSASHHPYGRGHGIALRSAPSLESFKSAKSGGAKSVRSLRSLRSLRSIPESVKSGISVGAREMKEWFKGRVTISAM